MAQSSTRELLAHFGNIMEELRQREVIRSSNNPVGDICESLVVEALKLQRLDASHRGCDAVDPATQKHYEIKGRRVTRHNTSTQLSVIRDLDSCQFDYLVGVLLDETFAVTHAYCIPHQTVREIAVFRKYVNGSILHLTPALLKHPGVRDITKELREAQSEWD